MMFSVNKVMSRLSRTKSIGPIGLDLGMDGVNIVQMCDVSGQLHIKACAVHPYPDTREEILSSPKSLKFFLRRLLKEHGFYGKQVVTCMHPTELKNILINYHVKPGQAEDEAVLKVIKDRLDGDLSEYVIDYLPIREQDKQESDRVALVAIAKRDTVMNLLETMRVAGFNVTAIEIGPLAIKRLVVALNKEANSKNVLVINCGRDKSYLTVLSGRRLIFDREVAFGENLLNSQISKALDLPEDKCNQLLLKTGFSSRQIYDDSVIDQEISDALVEIVKPQFLKLVESINQSLIYAASQTRGQSIDQIYVLGSLARFEGVDDLMSALIDIPVKILNPFDIVPSESGIGESIKTEQFVRLAVAMGLSLRGMLEND